MTLTQAARGAVVSRTFTASGRFVVPAGVTSLDAVAVGAPGQNSTFPAEVTGGKGAQVSGTFAVTPAQSLFVHVDEGGGAAGGGAAAPANGSGAGGGASDIRPEANTLQDRLIVAAGGGGAGVGNLVGVPPGTLGGTGGDAGLLPPIIGVTGGVGSTGSGGGASPFSGGTLGAGTPNGSSGDFGLGGAGGAGTVGGAGGGGGWYGGGGSGGAATLAAGPIGGGGGGSSHVDTAHVTGATSGFATSATPSVKLTWDDTTPPLVTITSPAAGLIGPTVHVSGVGSTASNDAVLSVKVTATPIDAGGTALAKTVGVATKDGRYTADFGPLAPGHWQITAEQLDIAGNKGTAGPVDITVDAVPPALALTAPAPDGAFATATPTFRGQLGTKTKDAPNALLTILPGDPGNDVPVVVAEVLSGAGGALAFTSPTSLADGPYRVSLTQADNGGGTTTIGPRPFAVDTKAPAVQIIGPADESTVLQGTPLLLTYTCSDPAPSSGVRCDAPVPSGGSLDTGTPGTFTANVTAIDAAGNAASRSVRYTVVAPAPVGGQGTPPLGAPAPLMLPASHLAITRATVGRAARGCPRRAARLAAATCRVRVTVAGTIDARAAGQRLTVTAKRGARRVAKAVVLRNGSWQVTLTLPATAGRWSLAASVPGSATLLPATARRALAVSARR